MVNEGDHWHERDGFERRVAICKEAFRTWRNGHFLSAYQPVFREARGTMALAGLDRDTLRINQAIGGVSTPAAFHAVLKQVLPDQETLEFQF
jgi:EAL domain-containing protein (putative c-di-GMP-specific phosphodiesterase class I)